MPVWTGAENIAPTGISIVKSRYNDYAGLLTLEATCLNVECHMTFAPPYTHTHTSVYNFTAFCLLPISVAAGFKTCTTLKVRLSFPNCSKNGSYSAACFDVVLFCLGTALATLPNPRASSPDKCLQTRFIKPENTRPFAALAYSAIQISILFFAKGGLML